MMGKYFLGLAALLGLASASHGFYVCETSCGKVTENDMCNAFFSCYDPNQNTPSYTRWKAVQAKVDGVSFHDWRPHPNIRKLNESYEASITVECGVIHQFRLIGYPRDGSRGEQIDDLGFTVCP